MSLTTVLIHFAVASSIRYLPWVHLPLTRGFVFALARMLTTLARLGREFLSFSHTLLSSLARMLTTLARLGREFLSFSHTLLSSLARMLTTLARLGREFLTLSSKEVFCSRTRLFALFRNSSP